MSEKVWTEQQKRAIEERGRNLLVSAAAGSGKTAVLSERVSRLVDEGTELESMLIITFTTSAAGEMRKRILEKVPDPLSSNTPGLVDLHFDHLKFNSIISESSETAKKKFMLFHAISYYLAQGLAGED